MITINIHLRWLVEDKVIIFFRFVSYEFIIVEILEDKMEIKMIENIIWLFVNWSINILKINKGTNFCEVDIISSIVHEIFLLIRGGQKKKGKRPNFRENDKVNIKLIDV